MFLKVADDFRKYTLEALPTLVEKLAYVSSLQNEEGRYIHWGLTRIFGDQRAQKAIRSVHSDLALEVLRSPVRDLCQEYCSATEETRHAELLDPGFLKFKAPASDDELLSAHLQLIQKSLVAVAAAQVTASQSAA